MFKRGFFFKNFVMGLVLNFDSPTSNYDPIPREFIELLENELTEAIKMFLDILLVRSRLANENVLDLRVRLEPVDTDECQYLPSEPASKLELCEATCGVYDAGAREITIFLGCLGRDRRRFTGNINVLDYTLFHLIAHHIQSTSPELTRHGFRQAHYAIVNEVDELLTYSAEVEADYLARVFSFISLEEALELTPQNRYLYELWQPLSKGHWKMLEYCREVEKREPFTQPGLSPATACYNPFRWLSSHSSRVLRRAKDLADGLVIGLEISATLVNRVGLGVTEPVTGLYIDEKSICFSISEKLLYICYSGDYSTRIRGAGYELKLDNDVEIDLRSVTSVAITFYSPRARVKFITHDGEKVTEARIRYYGTIPRPLITPTTISELQRLVKTLVSDIHLPPGYCDAERQLYVIALPVPRARGRPLRREMVLEASEALIPVDDLKLCIEAETSWSPSRIQ